MIERVRGEANVENDCGLDDEVQQGHEGVVDGGGNERPQRRSDEFGNENNGHENVNVFSRPLNRLGAKRAHRPVPVEQDRQIAQQDGGKVGRDEEGRGEGLVYASEALLIDTVNDSKDVTEDL